MHPPQPKIAGRTHPEMLLAEDAKRAVRGRGRCAEVRQMQSTVEVRLEEIFQSPHHSCVPPVNTANLDPLALAQALIITRVSASSSARATSALASTSGAALARWLTALCRFNSFEKRGGDGLIRCVCCGAINSCPIN